MLDECCFIDVDFPVYDFKCAAIICYNFPKREVVLLIAFLRTPSCDCHTFAKLLWPGNGKLTIMRSSGRVATCLLLKVWVFIYCTLLI